jgi:hypothetical protein
MTKKPLRKSQRQADTSPKDADPGSSLARTLGVGPKAKRIGPQFHQLGSFNQPTMPERVLRDEFKIRTVSDPLDRIRRALGQLPPQHRLDADQAAAVTKAVADNLGWLFSPHTEANPPDDQGEGARSLAKPSDIDTVEPPETAPELWKSRDLNLRENASQFVRRVYAAWLGRGLERKDLARLDPDLYKALSVWLSRHPEDPIVADLPPQREKLDELIDELSAKYPIEDLRKLGHAIDARLRRKKNKT